jgi:hypothetical protein
MASILFSWELGGGIGHIVRLRPLAERLRQQGHKVWLASKDVQAAKTVLSDSGIPVLPAPPSASGNRPSINVQSFADILHNVGFGDFDALAMRLFAWRSLFQMLQPDLLVCEYSPTALLAARGWPVRTATVGNAFPALPVSGPCRNCFRFFSRRASDARHGRKRCWKSSTAISISCTLRESNRYRNGSAEEMPNTSRTSKN